MNKDREILVNKIRTPDGHILESRHRHDYVSYKDANGETYMTDGGHDYLKRSVNKEPYVDMTVYTDDPIELIREHLSWGSWGISGEGPFHTILLKDMSNAHIKNIIKDGFHPHLEKIFENELAYRKEINIYVED